jgi:Fe-Mn family superoxide dismutase
MRMLACFFSIADQLQRRARIAMTFKLSPLPYAQSALEPAITARTMEFHYGKHHAGYVDKLNKLVQGTPLARLPLDEIIQRTARDRNATAVFNNAAQVWNHDFFWRSMTPDGGGSPDGALGRQIAADFGSFDDFAKQFATQATGLFGSGWIWLVVGADGLRIVTTADADLPMIAHQHALLTCDLWEHAYYLDYQNDRGAFVHAFLEKLVNWTFAAQQLARLDRDMVVAADPQRGRRAR